MISNNPSAGCGGPSGAAEIHVGMKDKNQTNMTNINKKTSIKLFLLFIPVSFASYLFHEFGHWIIGEALGNKMG